ncbi:MAG: hypothetical protein GYA55_03130 [SAR324 cluster bacterium]|uniref:Uncharacterized protein n=1 Tax=SAR324 cluster bacterium TaxID=2024889 RepID=A0A7X9FQU5_9DELT|nr:hypothetical protein [SAR324 cluster bacterium]
MRTLLIFIAVFLSILISDSSFALKQYRCDGRVQYRPCGESFNGQIKALSALSSTRARWSPKKGRSGEEARVFEDSFERVSITEGLWKGRVAGDGKITLKLYIFKEGRILETRHIGSVELNNESTYFAFKSSLPRDRNWTWVIKAYS